MTARLDTRPFRQPLEMIATCPAARRRNRVDMLGSQALTIPLVRIAHQQSWPKGIDDEAGEIWIILVSLIYNFIYRPRLLLRLRVVMTILIRRPSPSPMGLAAFTRSPPHHLYVTFLPSIFGFSSNCFQRVGMIHLSEALVSPKRRNARANHRHCRNPCPPILNRTLPHRRRPPTTKIVPHPPLFPPVRQRSVWQRSTPTIVESRGSQGCGGHFRLVAHLN